MSEDYRLKGNPIFKKKEIPHIGNLIYDKKGQEIIAKLNEKFKGINGIEYTEQYLPKKGQPIAYSNVPRILCIDQILREEFPEDIMRVLSPIDVILCGDVIPERGDTYADTNSVSAYPNKGPNEELRQDVLNIIGKANKKTKKPLIVSCLGVEKDTTRDYGFKFTKTDYTDSIEASFLTKDQNINYSNGKIVPSEKGIPIWVSDEQSGLRGLYRGRNRGLYAGGEDLLYSSGDGRVQLIQDPKGLHKNFDQSIKVTREKEGRLFIRIKRSN